ncbi:MAG: TatD family hydrolase [Xanthomonadales bacterium]|nr:TatD family hydrolase [Xanthomonadales bacterium]
MIDFHCHLDLYPDPHAVATACLERGLYVLSVTTTPSAWKGTSTLALGKSRIKTALGLHPQVAHQRKSELELFEQLVAQTSYVGEIGLDGAPEFKCHWADQVEVFERILMACANAGGKVLSLHSRRASKEVLRRLADHPRAGIPILHWFSGTKKEVDRAVEQGCWFSVGPAMLASSKGRALVERMPRERVLTESDGPFSKMKGRSIFPWETSLAVHALSALWKVPCAEVDKQLLLNLKRLGSVLFYGRNG